MTLSIGNILALITGLILIAMMAWLYWRSRSGERRAINTTNQVLLPMLSAIVILLNLIFFYSNSSPACSGTLLTLQYIGLGAVVLLILLGLLRFFLSRSRDRRLVIHPVLLAVTVTTIIFLIAYLSDCLRL